MHSRASTIHGSNISDETLRGAPLGSGVELKNQLPCLASTGIPLVPHGSTAVRGESSS